MADTFTKRSLTTDLADRIVAEATRKAEELGVLVSIAVVDDAGALKAFRRMDGANLVCVEVAQDKAFTAVRYGWDTDLWPRYLEQSTVLQVGASNLPRLNVYPGGRVIRVDGGAVGAIGVSGADMPEDAAVAATWEQVLS